MLTSESLEWTLILCLIDQDIGLSKKSRKSAKIGKTHRIKQRRGD